MKLLSGGDKGVKDLPTGTLMKAYIEAHRISTLPDDDLEFKGLTRPEVNSWLESFRNQLIERKALDGNDAEITPPWRNITLPASKMVIEAEEVDPESWVKPEENDDDGIPDIEFN
jgi:hypothetical protein